MPEQDLVQIHASGDSAQVQHTEIKSMLSEVVEVAEKLARKESCDRWILDLL